MKRLWQNLAKCIGLALCVTLVCFNSGEQMSYVRGLSNSPLISWKIYAGA